MRTSGIGKFNWLQVCALICVLCGLVLLGKGAYMFAKAELAQYLIAATWQKRNQLGPPSKPWPWADIHAVATLRIPELGMKQYVMNEASGEALAFGPGYVGPNSIADSGHVLIAGHRDSHFAFLQDIKLGHTIETQHFRGRTARYKVIDISIIDSNIEQIPLNDEQNLITLVTCFPFQQLVPGGPLRYLVTAQAYSSLPALSLQASSLRASLFGENQTKPDHAAKPSIIQKSLKTRQALVVSDQPLLVSK